MQTMPSPAPRSAWSDEEYRRFWKRMADIFGLRWYEQNGPEPTPAWKHGLAQHAPAHVIAAVTGYETTTPSHYPPNLPQFLDEVRAARRRGQPAHHALPAPGKSPEQIARISAGLKHARDYAAAAAQRFKPTRPLAPAVSIDDDIPF
jgi:hypothetical protein